MSRRRQRHEERAKRLMQRWFGGQVTTSDSLPPELRPQVRARTERVAFDATGRMALEALVRVLPWGQAEKLCGMALAASPLVRAGVACRIRRGDVNEVRFPQALSELAAAADEVREVAKSGWFRRQVCAAVGMWGHARKLSAKERRASRGGMYLVEGYCQDALGWLIPRVDEGSSWSRSALWRSNGPFMLLGEHPRRPGREPGEAGVGLFVRWQPPAAVARYKGPVRTRVTKDGRKVTEQHALAVSRYDTPMCGRTAWSAARRGHPYARAFCQALCPWLFDEDEGAEDELVELRDVLGLPRGVEAQPLSAEPSSSAPERPPDRGLLN